MKKVTATLSALVATLLISSLPVLGEEGGMGKTMDQGQQSEKNECLLVSRNCGDQVDSIQQRIDRIRGEIARGSDVYTTSELQSLRDKLEDANRTLELIMSNGGGG